MFQAPLLRVSKYPIFDFPCAGTSRRSKRRCFLFCSPGQTLFASQHKALCLSGRTSAAFSKFTTCEFWCSKFQPKNAECISNVAVGLRQIHNIRPFAVQNFRLISYTCSYTYTYTYTYTYAYIIYIYTYIYIYVRLNNVCSQLCWHVQPSDIVDKDPHWSCWQSYLHKQGILQVCNPTQKTSYKINRMSIVQINPAWRNCHSNYTGDIYPP